MFPTEPIWLDGDERPFASESEDGGSTTWTEPRMLSDSFPQVFGWFGGCLLDRSCGWTNNRWAHCG